jgi:hypothetical protein
VKKGDLVRHHGSRGVGIIIGVDPREGNNTIGGSRLSRVQWLGPDEYVSLEFDPMLEVLNETR